jgi:flagellar hook assembly protein FlgD
VRATVFDAAGRAVRTLADEDFAAGSSSLQWNGTNGEGRSMSSGVYFLRVQTAGEARTQRLVLLK